MISSYFCFVPSNPPCRSLARWIKPIKTTGYVLYKKNCYHEKEENHAFCPPYPSWTTRLTMRMQNAEQNQRASPNHAAHNQLSHDVPRCWREMKSELRHYHLTHIPPPNLITDASTRMCTVVRTTNPFQPNLFPPANSKAASAIKGHQIASLVTKGVHGLVILNILIRKTANLKTMREDCWFRTIQLSR